MVCIDELKVGNKYIGPDKTVGVVRVTGWNTDYIFAHKVDNELEDLKLSQPYFYNCYTLVEDKDIKENPTEINSLQNQLKFKNIELQISSLFLLNNIKDWEARIILESLIKRITASN